jgi:hypothetical protein
MKPLVNRDVAYSKVLNLTFVQLADHWQYEIRSERLTSYGEIILHMCNFSFPQRGVFIKPTFAHTIQHVHLHVLAATRHQ